MLDGKDLEDAQASTYFENDLWLTANQGGGRVTLAGTEKDSLGSYSVLEVTPPVGRPRRFYVNTKTGLIDRATTHRDQQDILNVLSDYRRFGTRLYPRRSVTRIVGMPANDLVATIDSVWANPTVDDAMFRMPSPESDRISWLAARGTATLPFEYRGRHVWLTVSVNGRPPAEFLFDTGASITVIDSAYAATLGLATQGELQGQGAGASGSARFAELESIKVEAPNGDGVAFRAPKVAVLSINPFLAPFFWRDCAGVLGYDFISRFVTQIDYDALTITLRDPQSFTYSGKGASIPFSLAGTIPAIKMKLDGAYEGDFRVDVGSSGTVDLHGPFVAKNGLRGKTGKSIDVVGGGFGGTFTSQLTRMKRIELGPYAWNDPIVSLSGAEGGALASEDYAGNIGNMILERFRCTFDYERKTLHLEPGAKYAEPDRFSRAGVQLARVGDTVTAMQVLPGSPAEKAGLHEGDRVTSVDGKPVQSLTPDALSDVFDQGAVGRKVKLETERGGKKRTVTLTLADIL